MSYALIDTTDLTALGDAIRAKTGATATMSVSAMADAVDDISVGGGSVDNSPVVIGKGGNLSYWNYKNQNYELYNKYKNKLRFQIMMTSGFTDGPQQYNYNGSGGDMSYFWDSTKPQGSTGHDWYIRIQNNNNGNDPQAIPVDLSNTTIYFDMCNYNSTYAGTANFDYAFNNSNVKLLPKFRIINNSYNILPSYSSFKQVFTGADILLRIDDDTFDPILLQIFRYGSSSYSHKQMFYGCKCLRRIPDNFLGAAIYNASNNHTGSLGLTAMSMSSFYNDCNMLKEIIGAPYEAHLNGTKITNNTFGDTFKNLLSLHHLTFYMPNNTVGTMNASGQTIDLSTAGYWPSSGSPYNQGQLGEWVSYLNTEYGSNDAIVVISENDLNDAGLIDKMLNKNSVDFGNTNKTAMPELATYNRQSAIETINSLPDTSTAGGGNTIKFKSGAGSAYGTLYDMNELTAAEIAVATAKGWTVSLV